MAETSNNNEVTTHSEARNEGRTTSRKDPERPNPPEGTEPTTNPKRPPINITPTSLKEGEQGQPSDERIEYLVDRFREFLVAAPDNNSFRPVAQRKNAGRKRFFGITTSRLSPEIGSNNRDDYEQKYTQDRYGEETSENARIWLTYLDEAELFDRERVEEWKGAADVLLVFAGLFSAVITAFIIQASPSLQRDNTQISASLLFEIAGILRAQSNGAQLNMIPVSALTPTSPFTPSTNALLVNGLWFTSLAITLSTAVFAVIAKQWPHYSLSSIPGTANERARVRQLRFRGFEVWNVGAILDLLPILLYLAVGLFLTGIIIMLFPLDVTIAWTIVGITGITYTLYFISVILPIRYPECPYTTSLTIYVGILFLALQKALCGINTLINQGLRVVWGKINPIIRRTIRNLVYHALGPFRLVYMLISTLFGIMLRAFARFRRSVSELAKWREVKIKHAIKAASSLDSEALNWLYATSWNRSVHRMIARCAAVNPSIGRDFKDDILEDLSRTLEISETNLVDLRYGLCLDFLSSHWGRRDDSNDRISLDNRDNWHLLLSKPDVMKDAVKDHELEDGEYQSYLRFARTSSGAHDGVQALHDAISDEDGFSLPLSMWCHLFEEALVDDTTVVDMAAVKTVAVEILTHGNSNLFDWKFDPTHEPIRNAGLVRFNAEELGWWKFRYLFRWLECFSDEVEGLVWLAATLRYLLHYFEPQRGYSLEARPYEKCYLLLITIYRNLISNHPLIADKEQRQQSLEKLFASFSNGFQLSHRTLEEDLVFFREVCCVDSFWCESMTDDARFKAISSLRNMNISANAWLDNSLPFTDRHDLSLIYQWYSRDLNFDLSSHTPPLFPLLLLPQNRHHLLTILWIDTEAVSHFSKCLHNLMNFTNIHKETHIYQVLMDLFKSARSSRITLFTILYDPSVLVQLWKILVFFKQDAGKYSLLVKSRLRKEKLDELFSAMNELARSDDLANLPPDTDRVDFRSALDASAREFGQLIADPHRQQLEATANQSASENASDKDHDAEERAQVSNPNERKPFFSAV